MVHGPCKYNNPNSIFMNDDCGTKKFPKHYRDETGTYENAESQYYVTLKYRSPGHGSEHDVRKHLIQERSSSFHKNITVDNSWVVQYNPHLLRIFHVIQMWIYAFPKNS